MDPPADPLAALRAAFAQAAVADALAGATPPQRLLELIVQAAAQAVPAPEGSLFLVDAVRRVLTFDVVVGPTGARAKELTVPLGHGIAGLVAVSGQPLAIADAQRDPRHARDIAEQIGYLPKSILAVPVVDGAGAVVGVLELLDRRGAPTFDLGDMEVLGRFARLAALALELRRAHAVRALVLGETLADLVGLPDDARRPLAEQLGAFAAQVAADPAAQRALELAELVAAVSARGEAEQRACLGVLQVFAGYLRTTPGPGGPDRFW